MDEFNGPLRAWFAMIDRSTLDQMRSNGEFEDVNLDFKRTQYPGGEIGDSDIETLRKYISAFANTQGGIILWGVDSKSPVNPKDRSRFQGYAPIKNGDSFVAALKEHTTRATEPPVSGVLHELIAVDDGFVIKTLVPASDSGPHRTAIDKGQYYRRDADECRAMRHTQIADMFGRRKRPQLRLRGVEVGIQASDFSSGPHSIIYWANHGRGLARYLRAEIESLDRSVKVIPSAKSMLTQSERWTADQRCITVLGGPLGYVIHPGTEMDLCTIGRPGARDKSQFRFRLFADEMPHVSGVMTFQDGKWTAETDGEG